MSDPPADSSPAEWESPGAPQPVTEPVVPATPCWMYAQRSGVLTAPDGSYAGNGYSGVGAGLDNPAEEDVPDTGPIPRGSYRIGPAFTHPVCGPLAMRLDALPGTDTFGRGGFLCHGDTVAQDHSASHGCVILGRPIREAIAASECRLLVVTA